MKGKLRRNVVLLIRFFGKLWKLNEKRLSNLVGKQNQKEKYKNKKIAWVIKRQTIDEDP